MPVHDWSRVDSGMFHSFHTAWITHLSEALLADLFAPGPHDPAGIHGAVWERIDGSATPPPANEPLTLASYVGGPLPEAYVEHLALGSTLIDMPLFLSSERYVNVPLESTYDTGFRGMPAYWRDILESC